MTKKPRERSPFGQRLLAAREAAKMTQVDAAVKLGISQGTLSQAERTGDGSALVVKFAQLYGVNPLWLSDGSGEMKAKDASQAHPVSYQPFDHPSLTREELMQMGEVPARFVFALEDDAMKPHGGEGVEVLFHRATDAKIGAGVLVKDKNGEIHVRRKAQGSRPGHWLAVAPNQVYRALDSDLDGLELIAVWRGVVNRGLEDA